MNIQYNPTLPRGSQWSVADCNGTVTSGLSQNDVRGLLREQGATHADCDSIVAKAKLAALRTDK